MSKSLVLLGVMNDDKPHAARFDASQVAIVAKAAQLMGLKLGRAESPEALSLIRALPEGKLFATGKALVPVTKADVYDKLLKILAIAPVENLQGGNNSPPRPIDPAITAAAEKLWGEIKIGSVVLTWFKAKESSWWESVVTAISSDGATLTCRYRDYPGQKPFAVKRHQVGLIGPGFKA